MLRLLHSHLGGFVDVIFGLLKKTPRFFEPEGNFSRLLLSEGTQKIEREYYGDTEFSMAGASMNSQWIEQDGETNLLSVKHHAHEEVSLSCYNT